jgi:tetratricopeptide (TPR) repeat protein
MTTVISHSDPLSPAPGGRAGRPNPWRRLWQIPLLLAGLGTFGFGLKLLVKTLRPIPFETHVADVRTMLADGRYTDAVNRINMLANHFTQPSQLAALEVLSGDTLYLAQQKEPVPVRKNFEGVAAHYARGVAMGFSPTVTLNERWGDAALALGDAPTVIEKYEAAIATEPGLLRTHIRDLVTAYLAAGQTGKAQTAVDRLLATPAVSVDDRAWGLCQKIRMALADGGSANPELERAVKTAIAALPDMPELDPAGRVLLWIGRAECETGATESAREHLADARRHFLVHHLDDGRAALLMARLAQAAYVTGHKPEELQAATDLYQEIITAHAGTPIWPAARLGRAELAVARGAMPDTAGDEMTDDFRFAIKAVTSKEPHALGENSADGAPEFISHQSVRASLIAAHDHAVAADRLEEALHFIALLAELGDPETAADALRTATTRERRAQELLAAADGDAAKKNAGLTLLAQSAEDYLRHAHLTTLDDDVSGNSLWKAAGLLDAAGESLRSAAVYEQFAAQRPRDPRVPEALLSTGRIYQSIGAIDKAIPIYQRNIADNPRTPAAYTSTVNLARCFMTQGPPSFDKAEATLLTLVQENRDILPTANEFRISLFTLGELYYRNHRWADAILRLEEALTRYPDDAGAPRATFMLAESYRRSAQDITAAVKANPAIEGRSALESARLARFTRAVALFGAVISALDPSPVTEVRSALSPLDGEYLRTAYLDRAACTYELGEYSDAIRRYDAIAARFPTEPLAVESYVQIVNAYLALQETTQAAAAAERARWVLKRIPDDAFPKGPGALGRQYYEDFLQVAAPR